MSHDRRPALADLLGALLALAPDRATDRFDALLAELLASGRLDPADARELRWWQRESVRALGDHLTETVPGLLASLEDSSRSADAALAAADEAWTLATDPPSAAGPAGDVPGDPRAEAGGGAAWRAVRRRAGRGTADPFDVRASSGQGGADPDSGDTDDHEDPDGPYDPVEPRPAPEPTADRPAGARLRKAAADRFRGGRREEPPLVVDLRSRTERQPPPSARVVDTAAPPGRAVDPAVASPRRRLLLSPHVLTTRSDIR